MNQWQSGDRARAAAVKSTSWTPIQALVRKLSYSLPTGLGLSLSLVTIPVLAAEQIHLSYPPFPPITIQVQDLELFVRDGTISPSLSPFATLAQPGQLSGLRQILQERFVVSPTLVGQFANTQTGQVLFQRMGKILKTSNNENGSLALKSAFKAAATDPQGITLLNVVRQFPDRSISVDGQLGFQAIDETLKFARDKNVIVNTIQKQAALAPDTPIPAQLKPQQLGSFQWQVQTIQFRNLSRPKAQQLITADVYLPINPKQPPPVIVISHGVASNRSTFAYLARGLASYGYAVAVPQHPGSDSAAIEQFLTGQLNIDSAQSASEILNRPLDIRALLDDLQRRVTGSPAWRGRLNPQQVGVIGQSLGGYTALALGGATIDVAGLRQTCPNLDTPGSFFFNLSLPLQCDLLKSPVPLQARLVDKRVKAVIAINPITSLFFGEAGLRQLQVPVMILSSADDVFAPPVPEQIVPFTWLTTTNKFLVVLEKGTHFSFLGTDSKGVFPVPDELVGPDPKLTQPAMQALSVAFMGNYLAQQPQYLPFLSQTYVQSLVPAPFEMSLVTTVTQTQLQQAIADAPPGSRSLLPR